MPEILVLYYSHRGSVRALAQQIARGVESVGGVTARLRTVPRVATVCTASEPEIPPVGAPYVDVADLDEDIEHRPVVEQDGDCICLVATERPTRFKSFAARLMQPFVGI